MILLKDMRGEFMKKKLNVGIVGYGYMGKMHSMCYDNLRYYYDLGDIEVNLYAVATRSRDKALREGRFEKIYDNYIQLLEDENVDIVDICTPNFMHRPVLIEAIKAGKHIYCEKPLAKDLTEAVEVMNILKGSSYRGIHRIAFEYRFVPAIMRAKQLIDEGRIGKIINFNIKYYGCEYLNPEKPLSWQSTKQKAGGGVLYALGSHAIDLIHFLVGDITEVYSSIKTHFKERPIPGGKGKAPVEIEDLVNVLVTVDSSIMGTLMLSQVAAGSGIDLQFEIYGEKGSIKFDHKDPNVIKYFSTEDETGPIGGYSGFKDIETTQKYPAPAIFPPPRVNISWSRYHLASQYHLISSIINGTQEGPDLVDGFKVQKVMDKIFRSAEERKPLKVE